MKRIGLTAAALLAVMPFLADSAFAICGRKGLCQDPPPSPPPQAAPPSSGGNYGYAPATPSRDPERLNAMRQNETAAEEAWNRGDAAESERLLRIALQMADDPADKARLQEILDRMERLAAMERDRLAREERERQRGRVEAEFGNKVDDILREFGSDFDGTGQMPGPSIATRPADPIVDDRNEPRPLPRNPPKDDPIVDDRHEPPPLPRESTPPGTATLTPDPPAGKSPHYTPPPPPRISPVPLTRQMSRTIDDALGKANGNPVDAQFNEGFRRLKEFPNGDPQFVQEELSYLAGLARSYVGGGGRSAISPDLDPTQKVRLQLEEARGNKDADALRRTAEIRDAWQSRRNGWIASGTRDSRDGSLEGAIEVLSRHYLETRNPDILNAIRYMEGGRQNVGQASR